MRLPHSACVPKKKIRCLVIQLARLGDTLQSLMSLRAVTQLYPELEITFVARERFSDAAKKIQWLKNVITLPTDDLLGPILSSPILSSDDRPPETMAQAVVALSTWIAPLMEEPWDISVNWSYSESSSYLNALVPAYVKLGYSRRVEDMSFSCPDGWSQYIQAIVQSDIGKPQVDQNIHLTDILTTQLLTALQIHIGEPKQNADNSAVTSKSFFSVNTDFESIGLGRRDIAKRWISLQLGSSSAVKNWEPEKWAHLASHILEDNSDVLIMVLGTGDEKRLVSRFFVELQKIDGNNIDRIRSFVGTTDFDAWASIIGRSQWLIAGDTAAIHLASVLGTRVLNLSLGAAAHNETGPYGNGHYVIALKASVGVPSAEAVYGTFEFASKDWINYGRKPIEDHFKELGCADELANINLLRSRIRGLGDGGGVVFEPLIEKPLELDQWTAQVFGHIARAWYCGWVPELGHELVRRQVDPALLQNMRKLAESSDVLQKIFQEAEKVATGIAVKCSHLRSDRLMNISDRGEIENAGKKLRELDELAEQCGRVHHELAPFSRLSKVYMHNLRGTQLSELSRESAACYHQLCDGVAILQSWIKHTLALARPVPLRPANVIPLREAPGP